jgi:hypothetical protein
MRPFSSRLPLSTSRSTLLTLLVVSSCLLSVQTLATTHRRKNNDFDSSSNNNNNDINETPSNNTCETPSNMTKFRSVRKVLESPPRVRVASASLFFRTRVSPFLTFVSHHVFVRTKIALGRRRLSRLSCLLQSRLYGRNQPPANVRFCRSVSRSYQPPPPRSTISHHPSPSPYHPLTYCAEKSSTPRLVRPAASVNIPTGES